MKKAMPAGRQGAALILSILIIAAFMIVAAFTIKMVYNCYASANTALIREQAFYLAEAGLEKGKVELANNPSWYTDLPYYLADNVQWLASYAVGDQTDFGEGRFKIVREKGKKAFYSIGSRGNGIVVLKLTFSNPPFKRLRWSEL